MKKVLIIGSGPIGSIAAKYLLEKTNFKVSIFDIGHTGKDDISLSDNGLIPIKNHRGNNFMYKRMDSYQFIFDKSTSFYTSHALGGFSNVWGANISALHSSYISKWNLDKKEFNTSLNYVVNSMPISSDEDMIDMQYDLKIKSKHVLQDTSINSLIKNIYNHKQILLKHNIFIGKSKLAIEKYGQGKCILCNECMEGCQYGAIYNSTNQIRTLQLNPKFSYYAGRMVVKFREFTNFVEVDYFDEKNDFKKASFDILLIAAGSVDSTLIVNNSINESKFTLKESKKFYFPIFTPIPQTNLKSISLSHLFIQDINKSCSIHAQLYPLKPIVDFALKKLFGSYTKKLTSPFNFIFRHFYFCMAYLDSEGSGVMKIHKKGNKIFVTGKESNQSILYLNEFISKMQLLRSKTKLFPIKILLSSKLGHSQHFGSSLPMSSKSSLNATDMLGRPYKSRNVHVIDTSILPTIPATPTTIVAMANAIRICRSIIREKK